MCFPASRNSRARFARLHQRVDVLGPSIELRFRGAHGAPDQRSRNFPCVDPGLEQVPAARPPGIAVAPALPPWNVDVSTFPRKIQLFGDANFRALVMRQARAASCGSLPLAVPLPFSLAESLALANAAARMLIPREILRVQRRDPIGRAAPRTGPILFLRRRDAARCAEAPMPSCAEATAGSGETANSPNYQAAAARS